MRTDQNKEKRETLQGIMDEVRTLDDKTKLCVVGLLSDISVSLAEIADSLKEKNKCQDCDDAFDKVYRIIYDRHWEILNEPDGIAKQNRLAYSNWILDILTRYESVRHINVRKELANDNKL